MLCWAKELGLGADHAGILELDTTAAPGTRFLDALPIADDQIVLDVGANRPDLLCHKGVARELAVGYRPTMKLPGSAARHGRPRHGPPPHRPPPHPNAAVADSVQH